MVLIYIIELPIYDLEIPAGEFIIITLPQCMGDSKQYMHFQGFMWDRQFGSLRFFRVNTLFSILYSTIMGTYSTRYSTIGFDP